jgi:hypothetical protein
MSIVIKAVVQNVDTWEYLVVKHLQHHRYNDKFVLLALTNDCLNYKASCFICCKDTFWRWIGMKSWHNEDLISFESVSEAKAFILDKLNLN